MPAVVESNHSVTEPIKPVKSDAEQTQEKSGMSNVLIAVILLVLYFGLNLVFNIYNKWLFSGPLPAPVFVTATHQVFERMNEFKNLLRIEFSIAPNLALDAAIWQFSEDVRSFLGLLLHGSSLCCPPCS